MSSLRTNGHASNPKIINAAKSLPVATGELVVKLIRWIDGKAFVECSVGPEDFETLIDGRNLQSWPRFQAALFAAVGAWASVGWMDELNSKAAGFEWAGMVAEAMKKGAEVPF